MLHSTVDIYSTSLKRNRTRSMRAVRVPFFGNRCLVGLQHKQFLRSRDNKREKLDLPHLRDIFTIFTKLKHSKYPRQRRAALNKLFLPPYPPEGRHRVRLYSDPPSTIA
jgi:hypothetical protein